MIATAVAVALGHYPIELLPVSLARPARIVTPIAPPSTLYLHEADFVPFAKNRTKVIKSTDGDDDDDLRVDADDESTTLGTTTSTTSTDDESTSLGTTTSTIASTTATALGIQNTIDDSSDASATTTPDVEEQNTLAGRMDRLSPSDETRSAIERFRENTLDPALGPALRSDEWDLFTQNLFLSRVWVRDEKGITQSPAVREVLEAYAPFAVERAARKLELREQDENDSARLQAAQAVRAAEQNGTI
jgi:tRNA pseudouridine38-40 synthase